MNYIQKIWRPLSRKDGTFIAVIQSITTLKPKQLHYYEKAFTHRSTNKKDQQGNTISYERLEFVGDALLSAVIGHYLYTQTPSGDEGYLTKMRSKIVSREHLNEIGKELRLAEYMDTSIPVEQFSDNIHGNLFESLVGAVFLDKGYTACQKFIYKRVINTHVDIDALEGKIISYKSLIIEWCQKEKKTFDFKLCKDNGKDRLIHFSARFILDGKTIAKARGTSKKKAEEKVAKRAYFALQYQISK